MTQIPVKDANGTTVNVEAPLAPGRAAATASRPVVLSNEDLAALASQTTLAALLAKVSADPSTATLQGSANTKLDQIHTDLATTLAGFIDGLEGLIGTTNSGNSSILAKLSADPATQTTLAAILAKLIAAPATEAKQDSQVTALQRLAPVTLGASADLAFSTASAQSAALTGTLARLVPKGADCRVLFGSNPTALAASSLLIAGNEYYFAFTTGNKVAAIRDAGTDGVLNITVVG